MNLTLLAKVTTRAFFSLGKNRRTISLVYFHVYASYLPFLGPSPRPRISFPGGLSVSMPSRSRERSNFSDSHWGGGELKRTLRRIKEGWKILGTMFGHVWYDTSFPRRRPVYLVFRDKPRKTLWALVPSVSAKEYLLLREETILFVDSKVRDVWRTPSELGFVIF